MTPPNRVRSRAFGSEVSAAHADLDAALQRRDVLTRELGEVERRAADLRSRLEYVIEPAISHARARLREIKRPLEQPRRESIVDEAL